MIFSIIINQILILLTMSLIYESRTPLSRIHQLNEISTNFKRNIVISHQKLPKDFFPGRNSIKRELSENKGRMNLLSQGINRNFSAIDSLQIIPKR